MSGKNDVSLAAGNLLVYKGQPAVVRSAGEKVEIQTGDGRSLRVRPKDVQLLHPGPLNSAAGLQPPDGDVPTAWELLDGESPAFAELAELVYDEWTPASAWGTWELLQNGLHFSGTLDAITVRSAAEVNATQEALARKEAARVKQAELVERLKAGTPQPQDIESLGDEIALARGAQGRKSAILKQMGESSTPDAAYALLLRSGVWTVADHPWAERNDVDRSTPAVELRELPQEERLDLRALAAYAIDDSGSSDPDDAISLDGERLWVHVADVAALVPPDSPADLAARARGANLYLPEMTVPMLPPAATAALGLGLADESPALSIGFELQDGELTNVEIRPTTLAVTRLTYAEADQQLDEAAAPTAHSANLQALYALTKKLRERRRSRDAAFIEFPEVKLRVREGVVTITDLPRLRSRELVAECMLAAGEAVARFALENEIPFPFTNQAPPEEVREPETLAEMFAYRKTFKRSQMQSVAAPHFGLGLEVYARVTSPLRRYLDLVVHQQLRAFISGGTVLDEQEMLARVGAAEAIGGTVRRAEREANRHWTMVFLQQNPDWRGTAVILERRKSAAHVVIPELGYETSVSVPPHAEPDEEFEIYCDKVDLVRLDARLLTV